FAIDSAAGLAFVTAGSAGPGWVIGVDLRTGRLLRTVHVGGFPQGAAVDPAHGHLLVVATNLSSYPLPGSGETLVFDERTMRLLRKVRTGTRPDAITVDAQAGRAFVTDDTDTVYLLDTRSGHVMQSFPAH